MNLHGECRQLAPGEEPDVSDEAEEEAEAPPSPTDDQGLGFDFKVGKMEGGDLFLFRCRGLLERDGKKKFLCRFRPQGLRKEGKGEPL